MSITWFTGNSGAGKTTIAEALATCGAIDLDVSSPFHKAILLDGDTLRGIWTDLKLSEKDRREQNNRVAGLAKMLDLQGCNVIVSVICPYADQRKQIKEMINCKFVFVEGGKEGEKYPYDKPNLYKK